MREPIPFSLSSITEDEIAAVTAVLRSGWLTTGEQAASFETELAAYLGAGHVLAVASCTHALEICLAHLDLPAGARVGVPTWTFISTALAGVHVGLRPVLLDIEDDALNMAPHSLAAAVKDLDVVIPVHFGGVPVDDRIFEICDDAGIPVIEDAAHSLGARYADGELVDGSRSLAACYSFYATKNLTSGEGGAIATANEALADFGASHRLHGMTRDAWRRYKPDGAPLYDLIGPGIKANFPDILAALARTQLGRFDEMQARRKSIVYRYRANLRDIDGLRFVPGERPTGSADHLAVVLLPVRSERADVVQRMGDLLISTSVHFRPLHQFGWMSKNATVGPSGVSAANALADRALSLPLYPDMTDAQVDRVSEALASIVTDRE